MKAPGWTEGRYNSFITSVLRGGMRRWPPKWEALKAAHTSTKVGKSGRKAKHYKCAMCSEEFTSTNVEVDHIEPVVGKEGFKDWNTFIDRLYCSTNNLQVLCKPCHALKTKEERKWKQPKSKVTPTKKSKSSSSGKRKVATTSTRPSSARSSRKVEAKKTSKPSKA